MNGTSGDGGVRWNDETQRWETAGDAAAPVRPTAPPPPMPSQVPTGPAHPDEAYGPYDITRPVTPPPAPTPRSRRTTVLVAAAAAAAVAGGIAGGVLATRGDDGRNEPGPQAASAVSPSGTATWYDDRGATPTDSVGSAARTPGPSSPDPAGTPSPTAPPPGFRIARDTAGFTIAVPDGWEREEKKKGGVFYNSPDGRSLIQIFTVTEGDLAPYQALSETSRSLAESTENYTEISLQNLPRESGEAAELVYAYDRPDGTRRQAVDRAFTAEDGTQYAVLAAGPEEDWPRQREILEVALAHFAQ
ncbi:serine/arginine repetitive matrix protein 2 [Streptomyces sp. NPDC052682]|uniref:serine/arginine repetitive matrix protein 2 n=1 Tax=Streptomyces sp. NPDC052682 TaxID=3154954 RepID=UPI0034403B1D